MKAFITSIALAALTACSGGSSGDGTQHIISYGQSLSLGVRSVVSYPDNPTLPNDYQDVGLMFADGVRSLGGQPLVPFKESLKDGDYNTWVMDVPGETPLYGALLQLKGLAGTRIGSAAGRGGMPIAELSKDTAPYARLLNQVTSAKAQSEPPYTVPAIIWMQGESDAFNSNYAADFSALVADLDKDVRAITGQSKPVQIHVCLTSYAVPAAAQQAVAASNPNVHIDCDSSNFAKADGVHLLASGSRAAGMALGASILKGLK
jgi:Carbohydrate esterase, sialic acid-specific acetylesterase